MTDNHIIVNRILDPSDSTFLERPDIQKRRMYSADGEGSGPISLLSKETVQWAMKIRYPASASHHHFPSPQDITCGHLLLFGFSVLEVETKSPKKQTKPAKASQIEGDLGESSMIGET